MRRASLATSMLFWASSAVAAQAPPPCSGGFDYTISTEAASPGQSFQMYGNWGPEQLDRTPDLVTGGEMQGGAGRLEVLEWTEERVEVRIGPRVRPGRYSLSIFCGERHQYVSPYKTLTVLQPNPRFDYSLSSSNVEAGESLKLIGNWGLRMDRRPVLTYDRGRKQVNLEVLDWKDDVAEVRIPVFVDGSELVSGDALPAEIYVASDKPYLVAGYKEVEVLPPSAEVLRRARIDEGPIAPWISDSPKNLAIVAGIAFLLGTAVLGLSGMMAASADLGLASVFLITWVWPYTFGRPLHPELGLLFMIEFIVIHASAVLGSLSTIQTTTRNKVGLVVGCCGLYLLFVGGFSYAHQTIWPLVCFWMLTVTKFVPLFTTKARDWDRATLVARAAVGTVAYLTAAFLGSFLPMPRFGWPEGLSMGEGIFEAEPYRLMFAGMLYFAMMGFYESFVAKHPRPPVGPPSRSSPEDRSHPAFG